MKVKKKIWSLKEVEYLRNNYSTSSFEEMQEVLGRTKDAISVKARLMKLRRVRKGEKLKPKMETRRG